MHWKSFSKQWSSVTRRLAVIGEAASDLICDRPFRVVALVALLASAGLTAHVSQLESDIMHQAALQSAAHYAKALSQLRSVYGTEVAARAIAQGIEVTDDYRTNDRAIPSPLALAIQMGNQVGSLEAGGRVRLYSPYDTLGARELKKFPDPFVGDAWSHLENNPHTPFYRYETVNGRYSVRYAIAELAGTDCPSCAAAGLRPSDLSGVFEVIMPLSSALLLARAGAWNTFIVALFITGLGVAVLAFLVSWLKKKSVAAQQLAEERELANGVLRGEVAQRKHAENELAAANDRLSTNHATLERWAADLEIAHTRLREVDELKTKFLSEVSHELRSPMAAIVSAAKIITKHHQSKPEVVERFGGTIVSEGNRMTRLINDFLDLTKVESGCVDWDDAAVDVTALIDDAMHGLDALALEGDITLEQKIDTDLSSLVADRDRLIQVLTNLANNAIKFTPKGGTVCMRATRGRGDVVFSVEDTGPGIPKEDLSKVFDRFHQVRNGRAADGNRKGTGLGLCISREIVEHYGGRIWVESTLGEGSSFKFAIPATGSDPGTTASESSRNAVSNPHAARVIVMLENGELNERAVATPTSDGIECRACRDTEELVEIAGHWKPDVLVVSSSLAQRTGSQLLSLVHGLGISQLLVHSKNHGLTSPAVLDSSSMLVPSLKGVIAPGAMVLVADDDSKHRSLLEFELTEAGYEVTSVEGGQQALDAIPTLQPEAMILDLIMPGVDGLTVLERLRRGGAELPVLVYTAMDDPNVALAAKELGATQVFRKDESGQRRYAAVAARVQRILTPVLSPHLTGDAADKMHLNA